MIKVIIAGSRDFNDFEFVEEKLLKLFNGIYFEDIEIVSGGARGVDFLGERFAMKYGCGLKRFIANWEGFGKSAGYRRNAEMAKYADACVCFWDGKSRGTEHMINLAKKEGIQLKVLTTNK